MTIEPPLTDSQLEDWARRLDMNLEVTKEGSIRMMTPAGNESSDANAEIIRQLRNWWHTHKQGKVFDSDTLFTLPDGSKLGPDAAYITDERLSRVSREAFRGFAPVCPNFVIELLSQSDSLPKTTEKMHDWIRNGVELGWLIDPYERRVHVFTAAGITPTGPGTDKIAGVDPVAGFTLDLNEVWRAYE